ncbi:MAG: MoaD/ThiS family protein [Firmicutes bacterium]|nr:MoaD/ThiS family protein [Bacillota bacterium]
MLVRISVLLGAECKEEASLELEEGATVGDAFRRAASLWSSKWPAGFYDRDSGDFYGTLMVNYRHASMGDPLADGDSVVLLPSMAGG